MASSHAARETFYCYDCRDGRLVPDGETCPKCGQARCWQCDAPEAEKSPYADGLPLCRSCEDWAAALS